MVRFAVFAPGIVMVMCFGRGSGSSQGYIPVMVIDGILRDAYV